MRNRDTSVLGRLRADAILDRVGGEDALRAVAGTQMDVNGMKPTRVMMSRITLIVGMAAASVYGQQPLAGGKVVTFTTADGVELVGTYYAPTGRAISPAAILMPSYRSRRMRYRLLIPRLHDAGFAILTVDPRGQGDSVKPARLKLAERLLRRDKQLMRDMYKDVEAAVEWVRKQPNVDPKRLVLVGSSLTASVAFDYAGRHPVNAVVGLSPRKSFAGLDAIKLLEKAKGTPVLLMGTQRDRDSCEQIASGFDDVQVQILGGTTRAHGTRMFGRVEGAEQILVDYLSSNVTDTE